MRACVRVSAASNLEIAIHTSMRYDPTHLHDERPPGLVGTGAPPAGTTAFFALAVTAAAHSICITYKNQVVTS